MSNCTQMKDGARASVREFPKDSKIRKKYRWEVNAQPFGGKRRRFKHGDLAIAETYCDKINESFEKLNKADKEDIEKNLTEEAIRCNRKLRDQNATLSEATDHYLAHLQRINDCCSKTVSEVVDLYLSEKESKVGGRTLDDNRSRLKPFKELYGNSPLASINREDIKSFLNTHCKGLKTQTITNYWRNLHALFKYAIEELEIELISPVKKSLRPKEQPTSKSYLLAEEVEVLLMNATDEILPSLVLMTLCGLRNVEAMKIDWRDIHLDDGDIDIIEGVAKKNRERITTLPLNAQAWLKPYKKSKGPVADFVSNNIFQKKLAKAKKMAGFVKLDSNILRRTFITHHHGSYENAPLTVKEAGNSIATMEKHYKKPMRKKEAMKLWEIYPDYR